MTTLIVLAGIALGITNLIIAGKYQVIGFVTVFITTHLVLVASNYLVGTLYIDGYFDFFTYLNYKINDRISLEIGNGVRPSVFLLTGYASLLLGTLTTIHMRKKMNSPSDGEIKEDSIVIKKIYVFALTGVVTVLAYKAISLFYLPLPIHLYLNDTSISPSSISARIDSVDSRMALPFLFLSPIDRQITVVLFTAIVIFLFLGAALQNSRTLIFISYLSLLLLLSFNIFYLKRAPLFTINIWFLLAWLLARQIYPDRIAKTIRNAFAATILATVILVPLNGGYVPRILGIADESADLITSQQNTDSENLTTLSPAPESTETSSGIADYYEIAEGLIRRNVARIIIGESIEKFYAAEHWGTTFDYAGFDFILRQFQSATGIPADTLGYYWYRQLHDGEWPEYRISTAQDIILELYMFFGPVVAALGAFVIGTLLTYLDSLRNRSGFNNYFLPHYTGAMLLVATMAAKGFWSVWFAGGLMLLLLYWLATAILISNKNPLGRLFSWIVSRLPNL